MTTTQSSLYELGIDILKQVGGVTYDAPLNSLQEIAPDLARLTVEFGYGEIMSRKGLDLQTRQLCTVAALAAMANAQPQLRYHIAGALNVGCEPSSIIEAILLSAVYAGFPATGNGVFAAKEVFQNRGLLFHPVTRPAGGDRYERGMAALLRGYIVAPRY